MSKRRIYEDDDEIEDTIGWEMCDEIALANSFYIDYYEYWKHPSFINDDEDEEDAN